MKIFAGFRKASAMAHFGHRIGPSNDDDFILQASRSCNLRVRRKSKHAGHCQERPLKIRKNPFVLKNYLRFFESVKLIRSRFGPLLSFHSFRSPYTFPCTCTRKRTFVERSDLLLNEHKHFFYKKLVYKKLILRWPKF